MPGAAASINTTTSADSHQEINEARHTSRKPHSTTATGSNTRRLRGRDPLAAAATVAPIAPSTIAAAVHHSHAAVESSCLLPLPPLAWVWSPLRVEVGGA